MSWAPALILTFGIAILILCAIVLWPRKRKGLRSPDMSVGRDVYREYWK